MSAHRINRRHVPFLALAVLILISLACGGTSATSEPRVNAITPETGETKAPPEQATNAPEPTAVPTYTSEPEPQPLYLSDVVEQYDYLLSAVTVEDPTTPGRLYEPESGKKLVAVEVIVGNVSGNPITVNPLNATLLDSEGFTYQPELGGRDGQLAVVELNAGEKARGWIAFEIPEGATATSIKYAIKTFDSKVLQVGLAQPPEGYVPSTEALAVVPEGPLPKLGDVVEQYDYLLSAVTVEDPTTPGRLYEPESGKKLVAVEVIVGNVSGDPITVNPLNATLLDSEGFTYQPELGGRDGQLAVVDLNAGEKAKGWIAFEIPVDATPTSIKYTVETFSSKFLQTGLTH